MNTNARLIQLLFSYSMITTAFTSSAYTPVQILGYSAIVAASSVASYRIYDMSTYSCLSNAELLAQTEKARNALRKWHPVVIDNVIEYASAKGNQVQGWSNVYTGKPLYNFVDELQKHIKKYTHCINKINRRVHDDIYFTADQHQQEYLKEIQRYKHTIQVITTHPKYTAEIRDIEDEIQMRERILLCCQN